MNSPERLGKTTNSGRRISGAIALRWVDSSLSCRPSSGKPTGVSPSRRGGKKVRGRGRVCAKRARSFSTEFACKQSSLQRKMLNDRENVFPPLSSIVLATRECIFHCGHQNQLESAHIMHTNGAIRSNLIAQQREREQGSNYFRIKIIDFLRIQSLIYKFNYFV